MTCYWDLFWALGMSFFKVAWWSWGFWEKEKCDYMLIRGGFLERTRETFFMFLWVIYFTLEYVHFISDRKKINGIEKAYFYWDVGLSMI